MPSIVGARRLGSTANVIEKSADPKSLAGTVVVSEAQLRHTAEPELLTDTLSQETGRFGEGLDGRSVRGVIQLQHSEKDLGNAEVPAQLNVAHAHAGEAWILDLELQQIVEDAFELRADAQMPGKFAWH